MNSQTTTIGLHSSRKTAHVFCVEPWGEDYTLLPGEEVTLVASGRTAVPWFNLVEQDDCTLVCCEETAEFKVLQGCRQLECGHQRRAQ